MKIKVLIVDDNEDDLYFFEQVLKKMNFEVKKASNGKVALEIVAQEKFDLIISDIFMPILDGFRFCQNVRDIKDKKDTLIILTSAIYGGEEDEKLAYKCGADKYLPKPIDPDTLRCEVETIIDSVKTIKHKSITEKVKTEFLEDHNLRLIQKLEEKISDLEELNKRLDSMGQELEIHVQHRSKELEASEAKYRNLFRKSPHIIQSLDSNGNVIEVNDAWYKVMGYSKEEVHGLNLGNILDDYYIDECMMHFKTVMSGKSINYIEVVFINKGGNQVYLEGNAQPIIKNENVIGTWGVFRDVTEQREIEKELERFKKGFDESANSQVLAKFIDGDVQIIYVNKAFTRYYGYSLEEILRQNPKALNSGLHDRAFFEKMWKSILNSKIGYWSGEITNKKKDGNFISVILTINTIFDENGHPEFFTASYVDITKRKETEKSISQINNVLKKSLEQEKIKDVYSIIQQGALAVTGAKYGFIARYSEEDGFEVVSFGDTVFRNCNVPKDFIMKNLDSMLGLIITNKVLLMVNDLESKSKKKSQIPEGHIPIHNFLGAPIIYKNKAVGEICVANKEGGFTHRDREFIEILAANATGLIQLFKSRDEIRKSEVMYRELFSNAPNAYFSIGIDKTIIKCNKAAIALLGYNREEILQMKVFDLYHGSEMGLKRIKLVFQELLKGGKIEDQELQMKHKDGHPIWVSLTVKPRLDEYGDVYESHSMVIDISERKKAEEERIEKRILLAIKEVFELEHSYDTVEEFLEKCLEIAGQLTYSNFCVLGELDEHGGLSPVVIHSEKISPDPVLKDRMLKMLEEKKSSGIFWLAYGEGKTILINDPENHPSYEKIPKFIENFLIIPLKHAEKIVGMISLANKESGYNNDDLKAIEALSSVIIVALMRKRAEQKLIGSEEKYRLLFNATNDALYILGSKNNFIEINSIACERLGYSREEMLNLTPLDINAPELKKVVVEKIQEIKKGQKKAFEMVHITKDGHRIPVEINASLINYGGKDAILAIAHDITERKKSEVALKESEKKYRDIIENAKEGYYEVDLKGNLIFFNEALRKLLKYSFDELKGMSYTEIMNKEGSERIFEAFNEVLSTRKEKSNFEYTLVSKDQDIIYGITSINLRLNEESNIIGFSGFMRNLTEQKSAEQKLIESEKRYKGLFEGAPNSIIIVNPKGMVIDCNSATESLLGFTKDDLINMDFRTIISIPPSKIEEHNKIFKKILARKSIKFIELQIYKKNREEIWVRMFPSIIPIGKEIYIHNILQDITQEKETKKEIEKLSKSLHEIDAIIENAPLAIFVLDVKGNILRANRISEDLFLYKQDELREMNIYNFIEKNSIENLKLHYIKGIYDLQESNIKEAILYKKDKKRFHAEISSTVLNIKDQIVIQSYISDISERKYLEEQRERMLENLQTAVDFKNRFLASVSHDLRTPLNAIIGFSDLFLEDAYGYLNEEQKDRIGDVLSSAEHLLELINDLLDITKIEAGKQKLHQETLNLGPIISKIHSTIKPLYLVKNLDFSIEGLEQVQEIYADKTRFKEIMYNLLSNAIKYTPKGSIKLKIRDKVDHWWFYIIDTGIGIAKKDIPLIFQEFIRVESVETMGIQGAGLGLSLTKRLVELHGGDLFVKSEVGKGSTFLFTIPKIGVVN